MNSIPPCAEQCYFPLLIKGDLARLTSAVVDGSPTPRITQPFKEINNTTMTVITTIYLNASHLRKETVLVMKLQKKSISEEAAKQSTENHYTQSTLRSSRIINLEQVKKKTTEL